MRMCRMGFFVVAASLVACQDAGAPANLTEGRSSAFSEHDGGGGDAVFEFSRMVGNDVTGTRGTLRGQDAIGAPWRVDRGEARLNEEGELRVEVKGLVLQSTGLNPIAEFKAILSCLTDSEDALPTLVTVNLSTALFPASRPEGDVEIREELDGIPSPCYAPIVFVTNAAGRWAAISGF